MLESSSTLRDLLLRLSNSIADSLRCTPYTPHSTSNISVKSFLEPLLTPSPDSTLYASIKDFSLACALLCSSTFIPFTPDYSNFLSWIPPRLSSLAASSFLEFSEAYLGVSEDSNARRLEELGLSCELVPRERRLVLELMPEVLPFLKERIKESAVDMSDEGNEFSAASARVPVGFAILAAYQLRWFVTQVDYPHLGKLCGLVIPCSLTAVDH